MTVFDVEFARDQFPALRSGWALFDNAGGSVAPRPVIDRVRDYMERLHVQLGATYEISEQATAVVEDGHRAAAALVNADPDEIVLGASSTMNVLVLAQALRPTLREGDEIVVTNLDHECNVGAWRRLAESGVEIREWKLRPDTAALATEDLEPLLNDRTRLVCFTHCSNVVGTLHDVAEITRRVHEAGALVCVDGVAFAPHRRVDVRALGVDFYLVSLYKVYGPHLGLLYARREQQRSLRGVNHFFVGADDLPHKLMPGNVSHELAAGLPGILEYLDRLHERHFPSSTDDRPRRLERVFDLIAQHEEALVAPLLAWLDSRSDVRVLGTPAADRRARVPTVAFSVTGRHASTLVPRMDEARVAMRWGDFYAPRAVEALGLSDAGGVLRASLVHYNSADEVSRLIQALERSLHSRRDSARDVSSPGSTPRADHPERSMLAKARHILVPTDDACQELKTRIEKGEDFAALAKEHSKCPSGKTGGELGQFGPGQMVREFDDVVFKKEVGSVHGPVKTEFGFHLIEITERTD